jgi:hypothetical protein
MNHVIYVIPIRMDGISYVTGMGRTGLNRFLIRVKQPLISLNNSVALDKDNRVITRRKENVTMNLLQKLFGGGAEAEISNSHTPSKYPDWAKVKGDLSHLPEGLLSELQKAMIFIVVEDGKEHAAVIVRADRSEFHSPVTSSTPMRLHIDFYSGRQGDIFSIYPLVMDDPKDPAFKETWLHPYDDRADVETTEPLLAEARKRLRLLLTQKYAWMIFVDGQDQVLLVRKVNYTSQQIKTFQKYNGKLDSYEGKTIAKIQYFALLQEYLNTVPLATLQRQFLQLFKQ